MLSRFLGINIQCHALFLNRKWAETCMVRQHVRYSGGQIQLVIWLLTQNQLLMLGIYCIIACFKHWFAWSLVKFSGPLPQHPKTRNIPLTWPKWIAWVHCNPWKQCSFFTGKGVRRKEAPTIRISGTASRGRKSLRPEKLKPSSIAYGIFSQFRTRHFKHSFQTSSSQRESAGMATLRDYRLTTFCASFFPSLFSPPPLSPSFLKKENLPPGTTKLISLKGETQPAGAGVRQSPHSLGDDFGMCSTWLSRLFFWGVGGVSWGRTPKGAYGNTAFWEGFWEGSGKGPGEGVLRRVLRRGSSMGFTIKKGSEKGSEKGFWEGGFQKVPRTPPCRVRPLRRAP